MTSGGWRLIEEDESHLVGAFRNVFVNVWWGPATVAQIRRLPAQREPIMRGYPQGYGALAILDAAAGRVSADVRAEAERQSKNQPPNLVATAQVIEGSGFGAAAVRSVAAAMALLSRSGVTSRIFDSPEPAAHWLMAKLSASADAPALVQAVREARRLAPVPSARLG